MIGRMDARLHAYRSEVVARVARAVARLRSAAAKKITTIKTT
jgi:hypothetical protein